jgi:hypothetical protein
MENPDDGTESNCPLKKGKMAKEEKLQHQK